ALAAQSSSGNWVSLSPASGTAGQTLTVTLDPPTTLGTYTATLRITASSATYNVINSVQDFPIKIILVPEVKEVFLPFVNR
ncbi:MAG: BACON domain-containing carbohydrate-binding protein, partial [Anaerolineaceae bacterium]